jgi:hypothetical protein
MPDRPRLEGLKLELLRGGVSRVYVERTMLELNDHYEDLERAALAAGLSSAEAARAAREQLGDEAALAAAVLARPELRVWSHRWPRTARCIRSAATVITLPGAYCIDRRAEIARWSAAGCSALLLVASLLAWIDWMTMVR